MLRHTAINRYPERRVLKDLNNAAWATEKGNFHDIFLIFLAKWLNVSIVGSVAQEVQAFYV